MGFCERPYVQKGKTENAVGRGCCAGTHTCSEHHQEIILPLECTSTLINNTIHLWKDIVDIRLHESETGCFPEVSCSAHQTSLLTV